ncbi:hypothetical protein [Sulfitobacter faviae]|uniref:hypothetical protein n=1 Tax=Sulfitobacter faviae TaxID=1775881 RepID=UPI0031B9B66E
MNMVLPQKTPDARVEKIIKLAVMAVGGQGGGVLTGWIEAMARAEGYVCQATSVAGVAQRTGPRSTTSKWPPRARWTRSSRWPRRRATWTCWSPPR